jgi:hypothetical protein
MMGSFASVTGLTKIDTSGDDLIRLVLTSLPWQVTGSSPYMLKILDLPGAIGLRRYPPGLTTELPFRLEGATCKPPGCCRAATSCRTSTGMPCSVAGRPTSATTSESANSRERVCAESDADHAQICCCSS